MPPPKYTLALLQKTVAESGSTLLETYESCNATTTIRFRCKCGTESQKKMRSIIDQAGLTCVKCSIKIRSETGIKTNMERYGVPSTGMLPEVREKAKNTNIARYGTPVATMSPLIQQKVKATNLARYGVTCTIHSPEIQEKVKATNLAKFGVEYSFQAESVKEKSKKTLRERYGVEYASQAQQFKDKIAETNMKRFGVKYTLQSPTVRSKIYATNMRKYGVKVARQSPIFKEKARQTCLKRYGVESVSKLAATKQKVKDTIMKRFGVHHPMLHPTIRSKMIDSNMVKYGVPFTCQAQSVMEKIQRNSKKYKRYSMPSGDVRLVQGYEPYALNDLLKTYTEEQIKTNRADVPRIQYSANGQTRYYFPDIYIPHENRIIEVKSTWTYACKEDNIELKKQACIAAGYTYDIWCYEHGGKRVDI